MSDRKNPLKNPAEPATSIIQLLLVFWGIGGVVGVILVLTGSGSFLFFGADHLCVETGGVTSVDVPVTGLRPEASAVSNEIRFCVSPGTGEQHFLWGLANVPSLLMQLVVLLLGLRVVNAIRDGGLHTSLTVRRLRVLGWLLLAGCVVVSLAEAFARSGFLATLFPSGSPWFEQWHFPLWAVVLGCVLLSLARIIRIGSELEKDLEGTV
ncbi:DUF2975 domain-containing protein [Allokutzneria sp. A3M-2-11 16]|uniref:DUF2975 domain-containing protein n=1 Tax=Allokutzneria sp. A3M-2-11 16 TaxID=2962043 RepID=UPI0020B70C76|nr:DUF2975 domain-containing protein [Allokutzneria sp. A3M-2-11 16]MCP3800146.1 DUF2975 domain-containing protein [Allokutzneria sp. A3M-2-11 16]